MGSNHLDVEELRSWFAGRLPDGWFEESPDVTIDREEVLVVGALADVDLDADASDAARAAARAARVQRFREESRRQRMRIADEIEHRFGRKVSWGVRIAEDTELFTTLSVPVMTRLRMRERAVLDTLMDAGVARSRSEALAWCVRLVGRNESDWIAGLRAALAEVEKVRAGGPDTAG